MLAAAVSLGLYGYIRWKTSTPPTYWETIAARYYQDMTWGFALAFCATATVLAFRVTYQLASERPPMNDSGYWRLKGLLLSLVALFLIESAGLTVKSLDAYYAYYDAAHPAFGEGKFLKGVENGSSVEIRLEIGDQIVPFSASTGDAWKSFQWKDPVAFQYGEKTRTLSHIEALVAPEAITAASPPAPADSAPPAAAGPSGGNGKSTGATDKSGPVAPKTAPAAKAHTQGTHPQPTGGTNR